MQTKIVFHSTMTAADYRKVSYFNAFLRRRSTLILVGIVFLLGVLGLILQNAFLPVPIAILFLAYPLILLCMIEWRTRKTVAKRMKASTEQTIEISESGIHCVKADSTADYDWGSVAGFFETPNYFLAYTETKILSMPKRDIEPEQWQELRNLIVNTLPHKKRRVK